jgi:hypothetical protein
MQKQSYCDCASKAIEGLSYLAYTVIGTVVELGPGLIPACGTMFLHTIAQAMGFVFTPICPIINSEFRWDFNKLELSS